MKTPDQNRKINIQNTTQTLQPNKDILKNKNASDIADIIQVGCPAQAQTRNLKKVRHLHFKC